MSRVGAFGCVAVRIIKLKTTIARTLLLITVGKDFTLFLYKKYFETQHRLFSTKCAGPAHDSVAFSVSSFSSPL